MKTLNSIILLGACFSFLLLLIVSPTYRLSFLLFLASIIIEYPDFAWSKNYSRNVMRINLIFEKSLQISLGALLSTWINNSTPLFFASSKKLPEISSIKKINESVRSQREPTLNFQKMTYLTRNLEWIKN